MSTSTPASPSMSPCISSTQLCDPVLAAPFLCAVSASSGCSGAAHLVSEPTDLPCGHLACSTCIIKLDAHIIPDSTSTGSSDSALESSSVTTITTTTRELALRACPTCQRPFELAQYGVNNFCVKLVESFKVKCQYHTHGCDWTGILGASPYDSYSAHVAGCGWKPVICEACRSEVHTTDHEELECTKRIAKCEKCDHLMPFDELAFHQDHIDGCVHLRRCAYGCSSESLQNILAVTEGDLSPGADAGPSDFEFVDFPGSVPPPSSEIEGSKTLQGTIQPLLFRSEEELSEHYKACPLKTEQCPSCQTTLHSMTKQDHVCIPSLFHVSQLLAKVQSLEKKLEKFQETSRSKPFTSLSAPPVAIALFEVPHVTHHRLFARSSELDFLSTPFQVGSSGCHEFKLRLKKQAGVDNVDWMVHYRNTISPSQDTMIQVKCRIGFLNCRTSTSDANWVDLQEVDGVIQEGASQMTHTFQADRALLGIGYEQSISPRALVQRGGLDLINDSVVLMCAIEFLIVVGGGESGMPCAQENPMIFHLADAL